jgi:magnesium transporter
MRQRRSYQTNSDRVHFFNEQLHIPGTAPLQIDTAHPQIVLFDYNDQDIVRRDIEQIEDCVPYLDSGLATWVDVRGLGNEETWLQLKNVFNLHPTAVEDIVHVPQRPHVEEFDNQLVIIARMVTLQDDHRGFIGEQISFVLGENYLLTVQEEPYYDCLEFVRQRLHTDKSQIRKEGLDYLMYALLDSIIDGFFPILEMYGELIESLEEEVVTSPSPQTLATIYGIKRELLILRRAIWPQRDVISTLIRDRNELISDEVRIYLRDCYDHAVQVLDIVETYRELASSLTDIYLSFVSNRMNEVMKLLTIVSSIFIPLTFIAGVYGMNFNTQASPYNMPELNWYWGYVATLGVMLIIAIVMVIFFWRRGWFRNFTEVRGRFRQRTKQPAITYRRS